MPVSEERLAYIRELSNDERVDRTDTTDFADADWDRFNAELDAETLAFCRDNQDPEELHAFASTWNWDSGHAVLEEILGNPACEAATALLIYWYAAPEHYLQFADSAALAAVGDDPDDVMGFLARLEARYVRSDFPVGSLGFDPAHPEGEGSVYSLVGVCDDQRARWVRTIPEVMYRPVKGSGSRL